MARGRLRIGYPGADDMTLDEINAAPIIRSTVRGSKWPGVVEGQGLDSAARQQNLTSLQAAIDYAIANEFIFEMDQGNYEIEGAAGLSIPQTGGGLVWRAPLHCAFHQATNNAPILTIGSVGSSGTSDAFGIDFQGCTLHYLADQSANTSATALRLGNLWLSKISGIRIGSTITNFRSYRGIHMPQGLSFFSNTLSDVKVFRSAYSLLHIAAFGTGNNYENIYLSGVTTGAVAGAVTFPFLWEMTGSNQMHDSNFDQLNIEWTIANTLMKLTNVRGASFDSVHFEQNRLTNAHPTFVMEVISNISMDGVMCLDNRIESSIASGTPSFVRTFGDCSFHATNMPVIINSSSYVDLDMIMHFQGTSDGQADTPSTVTFENMLLLDSTGSSLRDHVTVDHRLPEASFGVAGFSKIGRVESGEPFSTVSRAQMDLTASYTLYGAMADKAFVRYLAGLAANATLTLSNVMGPAGTVYAGVPVPSGTVVAVRRRGGTITNSLVVENHDGTDLATMDVASTTNRFKFDGTNWSLIA